MEICNISQSHQHLGAGSTDQARTVRTVSIKVLLELARIHRLMTDFINNDNNDADFSMLFDGKAAAELLLLLKELDALSPKLRAAFKEDASLADLLKRMSSQGYSTSTDDLMLLKNMIDLLQNTQRKELSNP